MKKLLSIILLTAATSALNAQSATTTTSVSTSPQKYRFAIKANIGGSWLKSNTAEASYKSPGMQFGGGVQIEKRISNTASFVFGGDITVHSGTLSFDDSSYVTFVREKVNYHMTSAKYTLQTIDIPLCLKLKTSEIGLLTYWMQVGVMPSITWNASATNLTYFNASGNGSSILSDKNGEETISVREDANLFRASLVAGLGVEYNLSGSTSLLIGLQYVDGFTSSMSKQSDILTNTNYKKVTYDPLKQAISSKYFTLTAGILF